MRAHERVPLAKRKTLGDAALLERVLEELRLDARLERERVVASVRGGEVTLRGVVRTPEHRWAAAESAFRVPGVRVVLNAVEVDIAAAGT